jgi:V8-like Glu-specific endopeptidase
VPAGLLSYGGPVASRLFRLRKFEATLRAESASGAEALMGPDDRTQVQNTHDYPYRCICHLRMRFRTTAGDYVSATGTGWVIGKRTVITAGHCVFVPKDQDFDLDHVWAETMEVIPGRNGNDWPYGSFTVGPENLHSTQGWVGQGQEAADYGAIVLTQDLPDDFGTFGFGSHTDQDLTGLHANVVGYPGELNNTSRAGTMWGASQPPLLSPTQTKLRYRINTTPGQSGASVFYLRSDVGDAISAGIHNYGQENVMNYGTRITEEVKQNLITWRDLGGA